jgi:circadian clock protein KaiC
VAGISPVQPEHIASSERISSGVHRLDTMLNGGYYRGSSVLITGAPGTAKSTLTGAFVEQACRNGERALYVSFDEGGSEIVRNLTSVNIHLQPYIDSGQLIMYSGQTESQSPEKHLIALRELLRTFRPTCMVIDPLSALIKSGELFSAQRAALWLLRLAKLENITIVCTSLITEGDATIEATSINVSTLADVWIHVSYIVNRGERNRALTIVKARGTPHSNQVRELVLSNEGLALADVYTVGGEVLMGTLRYERELQEETEKQRVRDEVDRRRAELLLAEAEANAQMETLRRSLEQQRIALSQLEHEQATQEQRWSGQRRQMQELRGVDEDAPQRKSERERKSTGRRKPDSTENSS